MILLSIRVDGAGEETKRRALEALSAVGVSVDRVWVEEEQEERWEREEQEERWEREEQEEREEPVDAVPSGGAAPVAPAQADDGPHPQGWAKWVSLVLFAAIPVLVIAWIWSGDWRFGVTAAFVLPYACLFLVGSFA
ncbi:hypothetical protein [Streptomyces phaeofaciens]|uniref:hypothetical protein n=1 Tax=Streptomyces phaeofaciens TaxID=68254 RepID=UPI00367DFD1A